MAKIAAAYIADGMNRAGRRKDAAKMLPDAHLELAWKRLYCGFRFMKRFESADSEIRYRLFTDHQPPRIGDVLSQRLFEALGVEITVSDFYWRSDVQSERSDYFLFDVFEQLATQTDRDDQILLFGPEALVIGEMAHLYTELEAAGTLLVEASVGEVSEALLDAYREQIGAIRRELKTPGEPNLMMALNPHFLGLSGSNLKKSFGVLKRLFPKNNLRAVRGEDFLSEPGELMAAIMAHIGYVRPSMKALTNALAAMPDELEVSFMSGVPVILPGYGREPDLHDLFSHLLPDRAENWVHIDPASQLRHLALKSRKKPLWRRWSSWRPAQYSPLNSNPAFKSATS